MTVFLIVLPCPLLVLGIVLCRRRYLAGAGARVSAAEYLQRRQEQEDQGTGAADQRNGGRHQAALSGWLALQARSDNADLVLEADRQLEMAIHRNEHGRFEQLRQEREELYNVVANMR